MVLINGCSFVYGLGLDDRDDSYYVAACKQLGLTYKNIATPGASNDLIRASTITEILTNPGVYDSVYIGLTSFARLSLHTLDYREPVFKNLLPAPPPNESADAKKMREWFWSRNYRLLFWVHNYAQNVFLLQEFCRSRGIGCIFVDSVFGLDFSKWGTLSSMFDDGCKPWDVYQFAMKEWKWTTLRDDIREMFDTYEDEVFMQTIRKVCVMVNSIDQTTFVSMGDRRLSDHRNPWPVGNDNSHPGLAAHQYVTQCVVSYLTKNQRINTNNEG